MNDANRDRVTYYGRYDLSVSLFRDRCISQLTSPETNPVSTINDAIEAHQCKLMFDNIPELFEGTSTPDIETSAKQLFSKACIFINLALSTIGIDEAFEEVELQYAEHFWDLVEASNAITKIQSASLGKLIDRHPRCISSILRSKRFVNTFNEVIKQSLLNHTVIAAELIVSRLATDSGRSRELHLPPSLEKTELDNIMLSYINDKSVNLNYLMALRDWPSGTTGIYNPSPEVRVLAKRLYESSVEQFSANGASLLCDIGVTIDMDQIACKSLRIDDLNLMRIFGGKWLEKYIDPATIMNNLLFVFDYFDTNSLMYAPARKHEQSALLASIGMHVTGEYRISTNFLRRNALTFLETVVYDNFLISNGTSIESALEWVYNIF